MPFFAPDNKAADKKGSPGQNQGFPSSPFVWHLPLLWFGVGGGAERQMEIKWAEKERTTETLLGKQTELSQ